MAELPYSPGELPRKPLHFLGSSQKQMRALPGDVRTAFGRALLQLQLGKRPMGARPFGEGLPGAVMKLVEDHAGDTYRAAYTVAFRRCVYVLHVFKKKSASGIGTPRPDRELIRSRLKDAADHYRETYGDERTKR